ncbi:hypothetical protein [Streptomyces brasiliensis]|uniref:Uncharacterized protein n=1 Tax=Streptomyces brasiliensis TaxID=1954 RepID=A0A917KWS1_9ACTN|nr:hypothetical protein [Streptomyces brasiliensis]GGJ31881.1 hypothetical protein GCM10010121_048860 [Streptomyces brasiliensis]
MTQSGQGEPAREGIVLPSDGGEPLLPGMTSGSAAPLPAAPAAQPPAAAPTGGQAWGQPWGPEQQAPQSGQDWAPATGDQWGATPQHPQQPDAWHAQNTSGAGPLPPEDPSASSYGAPAPQHQAYGTSGYTDHGQADAHQQPYQQSGQAYAVPLPPAAPDAYAPGAGAPLPPAVDNATTYLPPVAAAPAGAVDEGATQYIPPVAAAPVDEGATQYIPPVAPGALPPEAGGEETRFLGRVPQPAAPNPDAEATQYIAPVPGGYGGDRQPPAEFDNLFRDGSGAEGATASTQQMPRFEQPQAPYQGTPQPSYTQPPGGGRRGADGGGRSGSRVPLIAAVGIGIVVLGVGAGAMLSGGGGDGQDNGSKNVAASAPASEQQSQSPAADPAKAQAVALDKLLADSGSSRASVIGAVADVKGCNNLSGAAADLRAAAKQRNGLVTSLSQLPVDKLPDNAALKASLTKAWQASASADSHYAAWADQTGGHHGCHKGQARHTGQSQAGDKASYTASAEKTRAAGLWNAIARKYGLTQRQPTQL